MCGAFRSNNCLAGEQSSSDSYIDQGKALVEREDYLGALTAFQKAFRAAPSALAVLNIAMCQKALYRYTAAIKSFERFLALEPVRVQSERKRKMAEEAIAELKLLLGALKISDAPLGAEVKINGTLVGQAPLNGPLSMDPGEHAVEISKTGFVTLHQLLTIVSGQEFELKAPLKPEMAQVSVECRGQTGLVKLDTRSIGQCPLLFEVPPGQHALRVEAASHRPFVKTIDIAPGSNIVVSVQFPVSTTQARELKKEPNQQIAFLKPQRPSWLKPVGWSSVGLSAVSGGLASYFIVKWRDSEDRAQKAAANGSKSWEEWSSAESDAINYHSGMMVSFAAAGAFALIGACLIAVDDQLNEDSESPVIVSVPGGIAARF